MKKRIIIISVAALVSVSLSLGAIFLLPKYFRSTSHVSVKKNDTVSGRQVSKADSTGAESTAKESSQPSVSSVQSSQKEQAASSKVSQQSSAAVKSARPEKVTKLFKPSKETACSSTDLTEKVFFDSQSGKTCRTEFIYRKILKKVRKCRFCSFCTVQGSAGLITPRKCAILRVCSKLRAILYRAA